MIDHSSCDHPRTPKDRAKCRKARSQSKECAILATCEASDGVTCCEVLANSTKKLTRSLRRLQAGVEDLRGPRSFSEANEVGNIDPKTLDDRIRASKSKPKGSSIHTTRHTAGCGALDTLRSADCTCSA